MIVATSDGVIGFTNPPLRRNVCTCRRNNRNLSATSTGRDPAARARIEYETARSEFQRAETLVKDQIISEKEYEQARSL